MKRHRLVYRGSRNAYYCFDTETNKRESLGTGNAEEAGRLIDSKNEAVRHTGMNLQIAQVYLQHSDPTLSTRTWQNVMDAMFPLKTGPTQARWTAAMKDKAFDLIRCRKLIETNAEHFFAVLQCGTVSTNMLLRRLHNFAVGMHYLPWPVLPKLKWPAVKHKERRAVTAEEHRTIIERERNPEIRAYYQLLWHLGGSQTDIHRQIETRRAQQAMRPEKISPAIPIGQAVQVKVVAPQDKLSSPPPDNMVKDAPDNPA